MQAPKVHTLLLIRFNADLVGEMFNQKNLPSYGRENED